MQKYATLSIALSTPSFLVRNTPTRYPDAQKSLLRPYTTWSLVFAVSSYAARFVSDTMTDTKGFTRVSPDRSSTACVPNTDDAYTSSTTTCMSLASPHMMASISESSP